MSAAEEEATQPSQMPVRGSAETQSALITSSGQREANGYIKVFYSVETGPGNITSKEEYTDLSRTIRSLMYEFAPKFDIPGDRQKWYHGEQLLDASKSLGYYGINGVPRGVIIRVEVNL